jgi:hypothetical protein
MKYPIRTLSIILSLILFVVSLTQTGLSYQDYDGKGIYPSYELFLSGAISFIGGGLFESMIWMANPFYFIGLIYFYKSKKDSLKFSFISLIISTSFILWKEILVSESGRTEKITSLGLGYWLWISSIFVLTISIFIDTKNYKAHNIR